MSGPVLSVSSTDMLIAGLTFWSSLLAPLPWLKSDKNKTFYQRFCAKHTKLYLSTIHLLGALRCRYWSDAQNTSVANTIARGDRRLGIQAQHTNLSHVPVTVAHPNVPLVQRWRSARELQPGPGFAYGYRADEIGVGSSVRRQHCGRKLNDLYRNAFWKTIVHSKRTEKFE